VLLSETITDLQVAGGFAIGAGLILARRPEAEPRRKRAPEPAPAE
jgi:hypothetical protein